MNASRLFAVACGLWLVLWLPPVRSALEGDMALHMVVQVPLLIALGVLLAVATRLHEPRWLARADWLGIPGIVTVVLGTSFWMLPRALDQAVSDPRVDLVKFLSLTVLIGVSLGASWRRMPALGRAFIWANFIPKLGAIGGLYLAAPTRLCAYYRMDQQELAGWSLIAVAVALGMTWSFAAFVGWTPSCAKQPGTVGPAGHQFGRSTC